LKWDRKGLTFGPPSCFFAAAALALERCLRPFACNHAGQALKTTTRALLSASSPARPQAPLQLCSSLQVDKPMNLDSAK
jgi:hypothetical protein